MRRGWRLWTGFAVGAGAVVAAMVWLTAFLAREREDLLTLKLMNDVALSVVTTENAARVALWRMDSALASLIEARAVPIPWDARRVQPPPFDGLRVVHCERESSGHLLLGDPQDSQQMKDLLGSLHALPPRTDAQQAQAAQGDYQVRSQALNSNIAANTEGGLGPTRAVWLGEQIALLREGADGRATADLVEGRELERILAGMVSDVLPHATVARCDDPKHATYPLATMPLRLIPGPVGLVQQPRLPDPLSRELMVAWICIIAAILAMAALLAGAMALAERRAAFVSAVTHELRTPITSLRLYADMLGEGMVADEAKRGEYLATIRGEAERLGRLVENVLALSRLEARLERSSAPASLKTLPVAELIASCRERLERRAREAGMELVVDLAAAGEAVVRVEPSQVEQALFNLVDNACKYAAASNDRRIELHAERRERMLALVVSDHGPGVAADVRARLFRPFSRSAREAAGSAPGVGLGLALSRRLARRLGGDLALEPSSQGARFALLLPSS